MSETTIDELRWVRPDLVEPFRAALPGARATVLGRLWGAFAREPLPGVTARHREGETLIVTLRHAPGWRRPTRMPGGSPKCPRASPWQARRNGP